MNKVVKWGLILLAVYAVISLFRSRAFRWFLVIMFLALIGALYEEPKSQINTTYSQRG